MKRNGLRNPKATILRAFGSGLEAIGLPGQPAPVSGLIRSTLPSSAVGSS